MKSRHLTGLAFLSILGGLIALIWLACYLIAPWLPAIGQFFCAVGYWIKRTLSFGAFWLFIALIIRALWWLGSMFKHKARS